MSSAPVAPEPVAVTARGARQVWEGRMSAPWLRLSDGRDRAC